MNADALLDDLAACSSDPLRFVLWAFPWGEEGDLKDYEGPEAWQRDLLVRVRDGLLSPSGAIREAIASGHGVGKSAFVAWIILWAISTFEDTRGVVTANTETQLKTKTWAELGKWYRLFIAKEFFSLTATAIFNKERERTWRIDMVPWSERNTEAFAGLHNKGKRILVVFDEGSAIPDVIWETTEGALTDANTQILWFVFGNPTKNTGRFRECFSRFRQFWNTTQVDSRQVRITNKDQIAKWVAAYGEDSDFVRVRVRGAFPRVGSTQFISTEMVEEAAKREAVAEKFDPLIIGVDVARFGDDASIIWPRKGRDARTFAPIELRGADTMQLAGRVAEEASRLHADAIFVDEGGVGGGVIDRLRQLGVRVIGVQFGGKADRLALEDDHASYANKRAEMWGYMREWLKGGAIPDLQQILLQLPSPQYGFNARNEILLEKKEDMKRRGQESPDYGDALALTFAYPVMPSEIAGGFGQPKNLIQSEYNPFDEKVMAA